MFIKQEINLKQPKPISQTKLPKQLEFCSKMQKIAKQVKIGHWNEQQQCRYYAFLQKFKNKFNMKQSRRSCKIFKNMAIFINTRNPNQCRSHHHKMNHYQQNVDNTLNFLKNKNPQLFIQSRKYIQQLNLICDSNTEQFMPSSTLKTQTNLTPQKNQQNNKPSIEDNYCDIQKINDIGNLRTETCCNSKPEQSFVNFSSGAFGPAIGSSLKDFPSTGLINTSLITITPYSSEYINEPYIINYQNFQNILSLFPQQQTWLQCYQFYRK